MESRENAYFISFVTSRVDYCNPVLAAASKTSTDKLQRVLNAAESGSLAIPVSLIVGCRV